jgi:hypothetical protein
LSINRPGTQQSSQKVILAILGFFCFFQMATMGSAVIRWRRRGAIYAESDVTTSLYINPAVQLAIQVAASTVSGGLAGAGVSVLFNRLFHWRQLRTKFYPVLSDMYAAYVIRMSKPNGRYWITIIGNNPSPSDEEFVHHRGSFVNDLVQYNELKEVRILRKQLLDYAFGGDHTPGATVKRDFAPESAALLDCLRTVHKKLGI